MNQNNIPPTTSPHGDTTRPGRGRGRLHQHNINLSSSSTSASASAALLGGFTATDDKPKFTLSAEAKEWYPASYAQNANVAPPPPHTGRQHYNNHHQYNINQHYHHNQQQYQQSYQQRQYNNHNNRYSAQDRLRIHHQQPMQNDYDLQDSIEQLISVMYEVTLSPGKFSVLSGPLVDSFSATLDDIHHTRPLVDAIVMQAISEANFRYNGARLCLMFDGVEPRADAPSQFRKCLLERCTAEEEKIVSGGASSQECICGFAMFLAELYMQLDDPRGRRIKELGESLCKVLKHLLMVPDSNGTKTICQILKLSGLALDADCRSNLDDIFRELHLAERAGIQTLLVRNVINLRQQFWGSAGYADDLADIETPPAEKQVMSPFEQNGHANHNNQDNEGMFFPDGDVNLTSEERAFLSRHLPSDSKFLDLDDVEEALDEEQTVWDSKMNEEEQRDFMEFLKISNQITR